MEPFNIITTATLRPDLIRRTFSLFQENLFKEHIKNAHLLLNIDRVGCDPGEMAEKYSEVLNAVDSFPFKTISISSPDTPSFSRAFYWLLGKIDHRLTFNLEEDWDLLRPIDFQEMVKAFDDEKLVHLRLSAFASEDQVLKQWNKFIPFNGKYYTVTSNLKGTIGWCGHPSLNRSGFLKDFMRYIDPSRNPEKQIKGDHPIIQAAKFGVWQAPSSPASIQDTGRAWMKQNGYRKKGNKAFFTQWEKVNENMEGSTCGNL